MTGLESITEQIINEAEVKAKKVLAQAQIEADEIIAQAEKDGKEQASNIAEKSDAICKDIIARAESASSLQIRKEVLKSKQEIITAMLKNAKKALLSMSDSEYCQLIVKLINKYSTEEKGEIAFNSNDVQRVKTIENEFAKHNLTLSKRNVNIDGGFILIYGDIEENCSITALFDGADEKLQDEVHSLLFSK